MQRDMRRKDRELSERQAIDVLIDGEYGVLSLIGDDGYPYGVPVNFVYKDNKIYVHCSSADGYKKEALKNCKKVSFTTVAHTEIQPEQFGTKYKSAIAFGNAKIVSNNLEKKGALELIVDKYSHDYKKEGQYYIAHQLENTDVIRIDIKEITGKAKE